jgi:hypothetical protein
MKSNIVIRCESGPCRSGSIEVSYRLPRGPGLRSLHKDMYNQKAKIRFYYINSVKWVDNEDHRAGLYQTGCGLNLKSKYATLCTCKLKMLEHIHKGRERLNKNPVYVAGLGVTKGRQPNSRITPLLFLGKVEKSFRSFSDIWEYLPKKARDQKDASQHFLGDLYPKKLIRKYQQTGRIRFPDGHAHAKRAYKKDLDEAHPIVFKEWETWSRANVGFTRGDGSSVASKQETKKFERMIKAPRQSAYGWKYSLTDLRSLIRRKVSLTPSHFPNNCPP